MSRADSPSARVADETMARSGPLGLLHGLPVARKDWNDTRGIRTTYGSRIYKDHVPDFCRIGEAFKTLRGWTYEASFSDLVARHRELVKDTVIWEVERGVRITGRELARPFFRKHEYSVLPATQAPPLAMRCV